MQDNPLWQYSLQVYGRDGVAPLLIALQDTYQADVNMLLCCGWLGSEGRGLDDNSLKSLDESCRLWRQQCVQPLRGVRRFLKGRSDEAFRDQVKALEIEAEQYQQAMLYQQCQSLALTAADAMAMENNLGLYGDQLSSADPGPLSRSLTDLAALIK